MEAGRERHWIPAGQPKIRRLGPAVDLQAPQYTVESTGGTQDPGNMPEHAQVGLPELVIARDGSQARIVLLPGAELARDFDVAGRRGIHQRSLIPQGAAWTGALELQLMDLEYARLLGRIRGENAQLHALNLD